MPSLADFIDVWALTHGEAPAITAVDRPSLTYRSLREQRDDVGAALADFGIAPGDVVAIVLPNGPEMAAAFLTIACSATTAPLNPRYGARELDFYLDDLRCRAVVVLAGQFPTVREVARNRGIPTIDLVPDPSAAGRFRLVTALGGGRARAGYAREHDVAILLHTSGTTSRPKIVPLTHRNITISAQQIAAALQLTDADCCLNVMPLFHIHGLIGALLSSLMAGARVCCTPGFAGADFFDWLARSGATWYTAVPTIHRAVVDRAVQAGVPRTRLRFVRSCSSALAPALMQELEQALGVPVLEAYGMTEGAHQIAVNPPPPLARKPGSVGRPSGTAVAVLDEHWMRLPPGSVGEIAICGDAVTSGYLANAAANDQSFMDGWFRTGDQGYVDADGYVFITGRLKEMINRGGEKIAPREIDDVLLQHPAVGQCVAFGAPHPTLGEEIAAAIVRRADAPAVTPEALETFVAARLADFKVPRRFVFVEELPRGATGKLQRIGLADRLGISFHEGAGAAPYEAPTTDLERTVADEMAGLLKLDRVGATDRFFALGADSLLATQLACAIGERVGAAMSVADIYAADSPRALARVIESGSSRSGTAHPTQGVVAFNADGDLPPLFFLHGEHLTAACCAALADRSGPRQPIFLLPMAGANGEPIPATVEEIAAAQARAVRNVLRTGSCHIAGYCRSAPVALELARQLSVAGVEVESLSMIDALIENTHPVMVFLRRVVDLAGALAGWDSATRVARFLAIRAWADRLDAWRHHRHAVDRTVRPDPIGTAYAQARLAYVPAKYAGRVLLLQSEDWREDRRWRKVAATVESAALPGGHDTCLMTDFDVLCGHLLRVIRPEGRTDRDIPAATVPPYGAALAK